jgi:hypothetical protein
MKASRANQIINNNLNGLFMTKMIEVKGWTKLQARSYLVEFATSGTKMSLKDFMEQK